MDIANAESKRTIETAANELDWYHSIELSPGLLTPGGGFANIVATREILRRCEVQDQVCLDVGAMDGLISAILCRRKAARVLACDRYQRRAQMDIVRGALGLEFEYLCNSTLADVRAMAPRLVRDPFDLIVFSGVLYHMYDPMQGLAMIRSMIRTGGIVVIETAAAVSTEFVGYFNARGATNAADIHNYWLLSITLLDYLLRYLRLKALDCAYYPYLATDGRPLVRVAIACRATEQQLPDPQDQWMVVAGGRNDDAEYPAWASLCSRQLDYQGMCIDRPCWGPSGGLDLYQTISQSSPLCVDDNLRSLALSAMY